MREILFRGKRVDNGKWVYGDLIHHDGYVAIWDKKASYVEDFEVISKSIGQYTNLKDKDGNKIFEGDIVSTPYYNGVVTYNNNDVGGGGYCIKHGIEDPAIDIVMNDFDVFVIGNVTDNPELLEVE